ncbi:MAG: ABC transporter permease [Candidatus Rokubacteria bacterium]|nr:ABC transporter permease [Candidatus Rokubacteria bacterium]
MPVFFLLLVFVIAPLAAMMSLTFFRSTMFGLDWHLTLANYARLFSDPIYLGLLLKSLRISVTVTLVVIVVGYPMAYWLARVVLRGKYLCLLLIFIPYWIDYLIRTYAWVPLLGRGGIINHVAIRLGLIGEPLSVLLHNEFAVHLVLVYVFLPFGLIPLYLSLERLDRQVLQASADLGASPVATFIHVILPLSIPGLAGGGLTVFILTVGAYVTPKLVGGPSGIMFGNLVADQFGATFNWSWGATLAVALAVVTFVMVVALSRRIRIAQVFLQTE